MAKSKKAQILAAVMCATTVVGISPAISSAEDIVVDDTETVTIGGTELTARNGYFEVGDNGDIKIYKDGGLTLNSGTVGENIFNYSGSTGTLTIGNIAFNLDDAIVNGQDVYGKEQNYSLNSTLKNTSGITRTGYNGYVVTDIEGAKFYDNGGFATKDRKFVVDAKGNAVAQGSVTADNFIAGDYNLNTIGANTAGITRTNNTTNIEGVVSVNKDTGLVNIGNVGDGTGVLINSTTGDVIANQVGANSVRTEEFTAGNGAVRVDANGKMTTTGEILMQNGEGESISMTDGGLNLMTVDSENGAGMVTLRDGSVSLMGNNGTSTVKVDGNGTTFTNNGTSTNINGDTLTTGSVNADKLTVDGVNIAGEENSLVDRVKYISTIGETTVVDSNMQVQGSLVAGGGNFRVDPDGSISAARDNFKVDANGNVTAQGSANIANGNFTVDEDGTTYIHANRSELQVTENQAVLRHGDNGIIVNEDGVTVAGELKADNGLKVGVLGYDSDGNPIYNFKVNEDGSFSAANGNFTVDADGTTYAHAGRSELQVTENQAVLRHGDNGVIVNENGVDIAGELTVDGTSINDLTGNVAGIKRTNGTTSIEGSTYIDKDGMLVVGDLDAVSMNGNRLNVTDDAISASFKNGMTGFKLDGNGATFTAAGDSTSTVIKGGTITTGNVYTDKYDLNSIGDKVSGLEENGAGISNGNFQVAEDGSVTNTIEGTDTVISTDKNGLTVKDENGSTTINGSGITVGTGTTITDGNITTGNINVDTINGKEIATSGDVADVNNKIGNLSDLTTTNKENVVGAVNEVNSKVDAVDAKVGDTSKLKSEVAVNGANTSLVDAVNAETTMRQQLSGRVDGLENRMGDLEDRVDKVGAMAAAIANLRTMGYDPEAPTEIAVGVGQYESETGIALGVFHYPNQDFMLSASISTSGDEVMGGIGATWKLGRKSASERAVNKEKSRELKAEEKAAEMKEAAQKSKVDAQRERHAKMLAEREAANK